MMATMIFALNGNGIWKLFYNTQQKPFIKHPIRLPHEWRLLDQAKGI